MRCFAFENTNTSSLPVLQRPLCKKKKVLSLAVLLVGGITRVCMEPQAPPHFGDSLYSPSIASLTEDWTMPTILILRVLNRFSFSKSPKIPSFALQLSTNSPTPLILKSTYVFCGRQISHLPAMKLWAIFGFKHIRAIGRSKVSLRFPFSGGTFANKNHLACERETRSSSFDPIDVVYNAVQILVRLKLLNRYSSTEG